MRQTVSDLGGTFLDLGDPYHRERWAADPYPAADLERIGELVDRGVANHVDVIFAISPGRPVGRARGA